MRDGNDYKRIGLDLNNELRVFRNGLIEVVAISSWDTRGMMLGEVHVSELNNAVTELTKPIKRKRKTKS